MIIAYRVAAVGGAGWLTLANESAPTLAEKISGYQPVLGKSPQEEPGFGAAGVAVFDVANARWKLAFIIERQHGTPDAAALFLVNHPLAFAAAGNLDLQITIGATVVYFPACAVTEFTPEPHSDQSTKIRYAFAGGAYTLTAP
jgi:hypothetical protein